MSSSASPPSSTTTPAVVADPLTRRRAELVANLRAARAAMSPQSAVTAATENRAAPEDVARLENQIAVSAPARSTAQTFVPRSMTMKLILERPELTLRVVVGLVTLLFGARLAARLGSVAAVVRLLRSVLERVNGPR